ncbi:DUF2345 domain-containing protein, partial [Paraburkholderia saeva]|uniref:DUF2345 domain-containing protein n=1 Tax=Paraburkholderia saeva TaxID=2777537 RepID=UPI001E32F77D
MKTTNVKVPRAEYGFVITSMVMKGSRTTPAHARFKAMPAHLTYRPRFDYERDWRFLKGPVVGVVTTSDSAPYGDMDEHGRYSVLPKFLQGADNTNLTAAKGKFTASALTDGMDLFAKQQVRVASESADIQFAAKTKIALNSGGASLEIEGGNMTFHCPGAFKIKAGS